MLGDIVVDYVDYPDFSGITWAGSALASPLGEPVFERRLSADSISRAGALAVAAPAL
jgi:hypothetical protein